MSAVISKKPFNAISPLPGFDREPLVSTIEKLLLDAIICGYLPLGERVNEARAARQMGVSRAPLREAARLLERRGLLIAVPNRGFLVRSYTAQDIDDLYKFRMALEQFAIKLVCADARQEDLARLATHLTVLSEAATTQNRSSAIREMVQLHGVLCEISGNAYLAQAFQGIVTDLEIVTSQLSDIEIDGNEMIERNCALLAALLSRDAELSWNLIRNQIQTFWDDVRMRVERGSNSVQAQASPRR